MSGQEFPEQFRSRLEPHRETIVVSAEGEIDISTAGGLQAQLRELLGVGFTRVVLDLREVSFVDSTGLRALLEIDGESRGAGVEFALLRGPEQVQRLFELTQTDHALRFIDPADVDGSRS